jgi:hypothetical protein
VIDGNNYFDFYCIKNYISKMAKKMKLVAMPGAGKLQDKMDSFGDMRNDSWHTYNRKKNDIANTLAK